VRWRNYSLAENFKMSFHEFRSHITADLDSRDSSVGIALGYELDARGSRVRFPAGTVNFFLHHRVQNGSGAHPVSYPMAIRSSFPAGKAARASS
jgi:hypothetical protein